jgi:F420-non-reducing hydrogenase iron-sulfur subunit
MALLGSVLGTLGLQKDRLMLKWISASEGGKFAQTAREFTEKIRGLGPTKMAKDI